MSEIRIKVDNDTVTDVMRSITEDTVAELKELSDVVHYISVVVKSRKTGAKKVELTLSTKDGLFRKESTGNDYYTTLNKLVKSIKKQFLNNKKRTIDKKRSNNSKDKESMKSKLFDRYKDSAIRVKYIETTELTEEQAILQLENIDHDFFVYSDIHTNKVSVLYKRDDGGYGKLEIVS